MDLVPVKPRFFYDNGCPICTQYKRLIQRKIGDRAEYLPAPEGASDFSYISTDGKTHTGSDAIEALVKDFPEVKDYMWALPEKFKLAAMKIVYKASSVVRKTYGIVNKGCNCGKH